MEFDRIYAEVDLGRIEENMKAMKEHLRPGTKMYGVVKTDAYGHGAVPVARTIDRFVCGYAVATVDEGLKLRRHGIEKEILSLGPVSAGRYQECLENDISLPVFEYRRAKELSDAAVAEGKTAKIHIVVDTGMSRIGLFPDEGSVETVKEIAELPALRIAGMFTHFARADEADKTNAGEQYRRFHAFCDAVKAAGVEVPVCHCSNSAGIVELPDFNMDAVRAGITIYGMYPSDEVKQDIISLKPAMALKSFITYIKEIGPGTEVSYGGTFKAEKTMRIATVSAGYGDGYPRNLSGKGEVLIHGKRAKILGRICMDQFMADLTGIPEAKEGDPVTLVGRDGDQEITMEELAEISGGFHYEIPCLIGKRVPRRYVKNGKEVGGMMCRDEEYEGF